MSSEQCKWKWHDGEPCPREVVPGSEWCIFHYPKKTDELVEHFKRAFSYEMEKQKREHPEYFDFTGFDFPIVMKFDEDLNSVIFNSAVFREDVIFGDINRDKKIIFRGDARFGEALFEGYAGFSGATFKRDADFIDAFFKGVAEFSRATFEGDADFIGVIFRWVVVFIYATFEEDANFIFTSFKGNALFSRASFHGNARFKDATLSNASFSGATFEGDAGFDGATFDGNAEFSGATFEGDAGFDGATFDGNAEFSGATFKKNTGFKGAFFEGDIFFTNLQLSGKLFLHNLMIEKRFTLEPNWVERTKNGDELHICLIQIRDPVIKEDAKMVIRGNLGKVTTNLIAGISLLNTDLTRIEFIDETWPREDGKSDGRKIIIDEVFLTQQIKQEIESPYTVTKDQVAQTYRRLRENYENEKRYPEAGDFLIGEMEVTRKYRQGPSGTSQRRSWIDPMRILFSLYYALGKYGESIGIPLTWSIVLILLAAELHTFLTWNAAKKTHILIQYVNSVFKTILAFFPFSVLQDSFDFTIRSIGTLLLALIFIALRRKLERR